MHARWYWGAACHLLGYRRIPICCQIANVPYSKISEEWLVIVIIHFSEHVKFSKVRPPATYLPHPKSMFAPFDVHGYGNWFPSNSVACSRNGNGNGHTNSGNGRTATALQLRHNNRHERNIIIIEHWSYSGILSRKWCMNITCRWPLSDILGHISCCRHF